MRGFLVEDLRMRDLRMRDLRTGGFEVWISSTLRLRSGRVARKSIAMNLILTDWGILGKKDSV